MKGRAADELSILRTAGVYNTELKDEIPVMVVIQMENYKKKKKSALSNRSQRKKLMHMSPEEYNTK